MMILKQIKELVSIIIITLLIIIPFRFFIAEPFLVEGISMEPNFSTGDYLIVGKISNIKRGDIVVIVPPNERKDTWKNIIPFIDQRKKYIKRIIGLPGEQIKMSEGLIFIKKEWEYEFQKLNEPYIKYLNKNSNKIIRLTSEEYFVLGDNRPNSLDSEEFGPILASDIIGEPLVKFLFYNLINFFPEQHNFNDN